MSGTTDKKFVTVFNCMDGRTQAGAFTLVQELFGDSYPDTITEPGIDGILAAGNVSEISTANILKKARISTEKHGSTECLIIAHCECAGNPVSYQEHLADLRAAKAHVESWGIFKDVRIAAFNEKWELVEVA